MPEPAEGVGVCEGEGSGDPADEGDGVGSGELEAPKEGDADSVACSWRRRMGGGLGADEGLSVVAATSGELVAAGEDVADTDGDDDGVPSRLGDAEGDGSIDGAGSTGPSPSCTNEMLGAA